MKAIVNVNESFGIGKNGNLLIQIPEDMKFFHAATKGKTLVMGRKTLLSFPHAKPLKGRVNVVLTRKKETLRAETLFYEQPQEDGTRLICVRDLSELRETLLRLRVPEEDVFVIGGEQVYRALLPQCTECLVTVNDCPLEADTFFPDLDALPEWARVQESEVHTYEGIRYRFTTYRRMSAFARRCFSS